MVLCDSIYLSLIPSFPSVVIMPDVLDDIIDKLPQSTLKMILELDNGRSQISANVDHLLQETRQIKLKQINSELVRKTFCTKSRTEENKKKLEKLKNELEVVKSLKKPENNLQSLEAYISKTNELEIKNLIRDQGDIDLSRLFGDVEDLHAEIKEYEKKISEAKSKCQSYDGFPPDLEQGKQAIEKLKERIKTSQMYVKGNK